MSSREEIEKFTGEGTVSWHVPHDIHLIPHETIRVYSPVVKQPPDEQCYVKLEAVESPTRPGEWVGMFTEVTGPWDQAAKDFLKTMELNYDPYAHSLLAEDIPIDDDWKIKEYRVHWSHVKGRLKDVLVWEKISAPKEQYVTTYVWCEG